MVHMTPRCYSSTKVVSAACTHAMLLQLQLCSKGNDVHQCGMTVVSNTFIVVQLEQVHKLQGSATVEDRYVRILRCLKESLLKATGDGLACSLDQVSFLGEGILQHACECHPL